MTVATPQENEQELSGASAPEGLLAQLWANYASSRRATVGLVIFLLIVAASVLAPIIAPQDTYDLAALNFLDSKLPPGSQAANGMIYWLGTDDQGRDMLSAILFGLRTSLAVGAMSAVLALVIGMIVGLVAAYAGGKIDALVMRLVDLQLSFPSMLVALILISILGQGVGKIIAALVAVQWAYYARTVRSSALVEREKDYVTAARCLGLTHTRVVFRHLMPNCLPPLIVVVTVQVAYAIALEATLSFLGIGLPITQPSLGLLIANGFEYMMGGRYWISVYPGVALLITIFAINLIGDQLRVILNPKLLI
jgi:peptide/nickel transport system permease protein